MIKPNEYQMKRLELALENKGRNLPLNKILWSGWKFYVVFLIVFGGGACLFWVEKEHPPSMLLLGIFIGVLWRDLVFARAFRRFKPISDFVTDWDKVRRVISENQEK